MCGSNQQCTRQVWVLLLQHILNVTSSDREQLCLELSELTGRQSPSFFHFQELQGLDKHHQQGHFDSLWKREMHESQQSLNFTWHHSVVCGCCLRQVRCHSCHLLFSHRWPYLDISSSHMQTHIVIYLIYLFNCLFDNFLDVILLFYCILQGVIYCRWNPLFLFTV